MLFKRRDRQSYTDVTRDWLWPKRGWRRAVNYVWHRVTRLSGSSHTIALGFAAGAFASFTPFLGLHFILGGLLAFAIGGNILASALGTFVGNPITFPFIWLLTFNFGSYLLGVDAAGGAEVAMPTISIWAAIANPGQLWTEFWTSVWPVIKPMMVGGVPLGFVAGSACYFPVKMTVNAYQKKRQAKLTRRNALGTSGDRSSRNEAGV